MVKQDSMKQEWRTGGFREGIDSHTKSGGSSLSEKETGLDFTDGTDTVTVNGGVVNETGSEPFTDGQVHPLIINEYGEIIIAGTDRVVNGVRVVEINPLDTKRNPNKYTGTASSTALYIDMELFGEGSFDIDISAGTIDVEVSNNNDTAVGSISTWHAVTGLAAIAADVYVKTSDIGCSKWVKITPTAATFTIYFIQKQRI